MRKISKILYLTLMLLVISVVSVSASSTSEALNEIQRENTFFELYGKSPTAPIVSNGAGNETVQMNFGSVNYDATDLILQGKNGFDFKIERKFEGSNAERYADNYINGKNTMTAMSTQSYGLVENISLVFRYYKENDINKISPYYVLFDSVTELRDQEYEPGKLSVRFLENANTQYSLGYA